MTSLLIAVLIAVLIVAVLIYAIDLIPGLDGRLAGILKLAVVILAIVIVIQRTGVL